MAPSTQLALEPQSGLLLTQEEQVCLQTIPADQGSESAHWAS